MKKLPRRVSRIAGFKQVGRYIPIGKPRQLIQGSEFVRDLGDRSGQDQLVQRKEEDANTETDEDERESESCERYRDLIFCWFLRGSVGRSVFREFMYA